MTDSSPRGDRRQSNRRLGLLVVLAVLWMVLIAARLYQLQVERHPELVKRAQKQQRRVVEVEPPRGTIYDREGRELAVSVRTSSVFADPSRIDGVEPTARQLASVLDLDVASIRERLEVDGEFVFVARRVEPEIAEQVSALDLPGIGLLEESRRSYPLGRVAANVLGFVGSDQKGLAGLESLYDEQIAGHARKRTVLRDAHRTLVVAPSALDEEARPGSDLHLTLDATLQFLAEKELEAAVDYWGARGGSVVLLDARDSAVLALASSPSFDPNDYRSYDSSEWRNATIMDAYEPGSTFKMVTAAAALETLSIHPDDLLDCGMGSITLDRTRIRDHHPYGVMTFREVIEKSSNVGVIRAALRTGTDPFYTMITDFGFGRRTGIDLPGENPGLLRSRERWRGLATAYASFGHGLSVTPLQLANSFAALANGGSLHQPYVVAATGEDGVRRPRKRAAPLFVGLSPATQQTLVRLLEGVVERGTAKAAAIPGYRVAGKTGTAEKSSSQGYSATGRVAGFVGFAPSRSPRLVAAVMLDEPVRSHYGGTVAAPVFARVVGEALLYLGVPPDPDLLDETPRFVDFEPARSIRRPSAQRFADAATRAPTPATTPLAVGGGGSR